MTETLIAQTWKRRALVMLAALMLIPTSLTLSASNARAQQSQWIWSPTPPAANEAGTQTTYFRKKFTLIHPAESELTIAAGDRYQLYVNGRLASEGESFGTPFKLDVAGQLVPGVNLISCKVERDQINSNRSDKLGLAFRLRVREKDETRWRSLVSDNSWKTRSEFREDWYTTSHADMGWLGADELQVAAIVEKNKPASNGTPVSTASHSSGISQPMEKTADERFEINPEFDVQQVMLDSETGSLIALEFNEFGKLILSRERGPLLIADPFVNLEQPGRIRVLCDEVSSCQGLLPLNGDLFVTGMGPAGSALYRLADRNQDGRMEVIATLMKFTGEPGEHGAHGLKLGPDGMIYVTIGNGSSVEGGVVDTSPAKNVYEGDLIPRFEDPGGHAAGVKAPGGTIVRCTVEGTRIEQVATGLRNTYDVVFDHEGELFTHDSDMESDMGMSWYRPTMVFHVPDGAEFGWRSGWSKFPMYFMDQTPAVCETGRGSPTGSVCYRHLQFPSRYHNTMFFADWSEGRILAMHTRSVGASYTATTEEFLKGKPLNVCDITVGEDGALYFCTGGRGTEGGVYRVIWKGTVPAEILEFEDDLARVLRHPQPDAAWARQNIARLKQQIGAAKWNEAITGVATEQRNSAGLRLKALDRMVLYGPNPTVELLQQLSQDVDADIRKRVALLCGLSSNTDHVKLLATLVRDPSQRVRVMACRSLMRLDEVPAFADLVPMLKSTDAVECMTARRVLERIPAIQWKDNVLTTEDTRLFIAGSLALVTAEPSLESSYAILAKCSERMDGFVSDADFLDMLRLMQLALCQGEVDAAKIPAFADRVANEFPSGNGLINRELARVMAFMKAGDLGDRIPGYLNSESDSEVDRLHVAMYLQHIGTELAPAERLAILDYLERSTAHSGGGSYNHYIKTALQQLGQTLTADQVSEVLRNGYLWPTSMVSAFYKLPQNLNQETVSVIVESDKQLAANDDSESAQARLGVVAVLAQSGDASAMEYLRQLWRDEPERRADISIGLAQEPAGENWAYLISSLPVLDDMTGAEVLDKLAAVNRRPRDAAHFREVINLGFRLRGEGSMRAANLLEHWTGQTPGPTGGEWSVVMKGWKDWFEQTWPNEPEIAPNQLQRGLQHSVEALLGHLDSGSGDPVRGRMVFASAQCGACHRCGAEGTATGPDLTAIARRFSNREILESIVDPTKIVPDQYRAKTILTEDGQTVTGMAIKDNDGSWLVTQANGQRVRVAPDDVEAIKDSEVSSMPENLLEGLTVSEIADLFAFLRGEKYEQARSSGGAALK